MTADTAALVVTRNSLHGVAELVLAGPQYQRSGSIRLRAAPGGFATVAEPDLAVSGDTLVAGDRMIAVLRDISYADLAAAAGVEARGLAEVYSGGSGANPADVVVVDAVAAAIIARAFADGQAALRLLAPAAMPVLWPEHFDIGITVDEVNYGVSPGDGFLAEPYAYVGPHKPRSGPFWNAPFGAVRPLTELTDAAMIHEFFTEGKQLT